MVKSLNKSAHRPSFLLGILAVASGCGGNSASPQSNLPPQIKSAESNDNSSSQMLLLPTDTPDENKLKSKLDTADGERKPSDSDAITAESLGLGSEAENMGKDPYDRYWFKLPGNETRVYNMKDKQLYRASQNADAKWEFEKIDLPEP